MGANLLIPSARYIREELQTMGKIPPVLYPLGSGIVFDYIYNQYCPDIKSITIVGFEGFHLLERTITKTKYPKTTLIELDKLGDLAYTTYHGLNDSNTSVIINFGDTIVDEQSSKLKDDCFYYSEDCISDLWTFFEEKDGKIKTIIDKPSNVSQTSNKLFCGIFRFSDQGYLKKCLKESFSAMDKTCSAFYVAILQYNKKYPLTPIKSNNWYDLGHINNYYNSKTKVKAREFNHITIDQNRGILRKTSKDKEKIIGEIEWYLKLPSDIEYCRPRIFSYSTNYNEPYVEMEYYSYHTIHELFLYGDLKYNQWKSIFEKIAFIRSDFSRYIVHNNAISAALKEMYLDKTISRLEKLSKHSTFANMFDKPVTVNGISYPPLQCIIELLSTSIPEKLCMLDQFTIIHGDLCFTNMLIDDNYSFIKLIDPRGQFGSFDIYGDPRYDLAKLFHSVDGKYDYIIKNMFNLHFNNSTNEINFTIDAPQTEFDLFDLMKTVFKDEIGNQLDNIVFIESLLFLSMIPLHNESEEHQLVMLGTGLQILDRVLNIRVEPHE